MKNLCKINSIYNRFNMIVVVFILLFVLTGCRVYKRDAGYRHGRSFNESFNSQVINPCAPMDPTPVDGMAGVVSAKIYNSRYGKEMTDPLKKDDRHRSSYSNGYNIEISQQP